MPVEVEGTLDLSGILADGRIRADGDLTISVAPFYYDLSGVKGYFIGVVGENVTDNIVNYVFLDSSADVSVNTEYPLGSHIRLGRVVASGGFITNIISERALFTDGYSSGGGGGVPTTRILVAGNGLTGGGDLSSDRTFNVAAHSDGSILVHPDDIQVGILATDNQHGNRGGGSLHNVATQSVSGFMSSTDKAALDELIRGSVTIPIRNETGAVLEKGRAICSTGVHDAFGNILVTYADKDNSSLRPAIGILHTNVSDLSNSTATIQGVMGFDTTIWGVTDQLVLGNDGYLVRPPPDNSPFTGEIQNLAIACNIGTDGYLIINLDGLQAITGSQIFALEGTAGIPGPTNKYVTDSDIRLSASGVYQYPSSATDPVSPPPADGYLYYNTVITSPMRYEGSRSKWLSVDSVTYTAGRNGNTAAGSYYRGMDGLAFGEDIGYPVAKGTLIGLSWARIDSDPAVLEVVVDATAIATLSSSVSGLVADWTLNADFDQGLLKFRNQAGSNVTTDVQITAIVKRRI